MLHESCSLVDDAEHKVGPLLASPSLDNGLACGTWPAGELLSSKLCLDELNGCLVLNGGACTQRLTAGCSSQQKTATETAAESTIGHQELPASATIELFPIGCLSKNVTQVMAWLSVFLAGRSCNFWQADLVFLGSYTQ